MRLRFFFVFGLIGLAGCAELTSVYHARPIKADQAITVDSYQRSTYVTRVPGDPAGQLRLCAEAAPDTFAALSASLAAEGDVVKKSASLAAAISQSGATIERTQTINLLRESMYRTCERYLSGALSKSAFVIQAARDQRTMLAVLAIEQLTRTARPPSTILAASGTSASLANDDAAALIKQFADEKSQAQKAEVAADAAYKKAKGISDCESIKTAPAADPELANWASCNAAKKDLDARQAETIAASGRLDKVLTATTPASTTTASTIAGAGNNGQGGAAPSELALTTVALVIRDIAMTSGIDEPLMFCIAYFSEPPTTRETDTINMCNQIIARRSENDEKARGRILRFEANGTQISVADARPVDPGDLATPILKRYLSDPALAVAERQRRVALAGQTAAQLRLIESPQELAQLILSADPIVAAQLLARLRTVDSTPQGKAALGAQ